MFRGSFPHTIDNKGRVSVPAKFREVLAGLRDQRIVMAPFNAEGAKCIDVYPMSAWERLEEKILSQRQFDVNVSDFATMYVGTAHEYEVDPQGRILIPQILRTEAGLKRDVVLMGALNKFRIWDQVAYEETVTRAREKFRSDPSLLKELGF